MTLLKTLAFLAGLSSQQAEWLELSLFARKLIVVRRHGHNGHDGFGFGFGAFNRSVGGSALMRAPKRLTCSLRQPKWAPFPSNKDSSRRLRHTLGKPSVYIGGPPAGVRSEALRFGHKREPPPPPPPPQASKQAAHDDHRLTSYLVLASSEAKRHPGKSYEQCLIETAHLDNCLSG